jgi:hypothetical protein
VRTTIRNRATGDTLTVSSVTHFEDDPAVLVRLAGEPNRPSRLFYLTDWELIEECENANEVIRALPVGTVLQVTLVGGNAASITTYSRHVKISDDTLAYLNPTNGGPVFNVAIQGHCTALPADRVHVIFNPEEVSK